ncbi:MAG TPA: hypothetical protein VEY89_14125, partial [Candidatus Dormibacteraeota bacterium]|nr:hypothetical protein [Candidatus Dormibacteraeota bacterium]
MTLSKRGKLLTGIAALIAAYVVFGPKDSDSVEPARAGARPAARETRAAPGAVSTPVAHSLLALAHRVVEQTSAGSLFASHSWYVAPPPPPPPPVGEAPPPPKPTAPPLPFTYMGSYAPNGAKPVFFLTQGDRVYDVHIGDTLDNT